MDIEEQNPEVIDLRWSLESIEPLSTIRLLANQVNSSKKTRASPTWPNSAQFGGWAMD